MRLLQRERSTRAYLLSARAIKAYLFRAPWLSGRLQWVRAASLSAVEVGVDASERNYSLWPDCRPCLPQCTHSSYLTDFKSVADSVYMPTIRGVAVLNVYYRDLHSAVKYMERRDMEPIEKLREDQHHALAHFAKRFNEKMDFLEENF